MAGRVKKVRRTCRLHKHLKELFFEVLAKGRESLKQDANRPNDQGVSVDQLRGVRSIKVKEVGRKRTPKMFSIPGEKPAWMPTYSGAADSAPR